MEQYGATPYCATIGHRFSLDRCPKTGARGLKDGTMKTSAYKGNKKQASGKFPSREWQTFENDQMCVKARYT